MNREILFRGKRADNGEWVEGYLLQSDLIVPIGQNFNFTRYGDKNIITSDSQIEFYKVIPETVGQYTGLTDKNGTKIFEGDIIKIRNKTRYVFFGVCRYRHTKYGGYAVDLSVKDGSNCEVIGNIYDNPELLEEQK